MTDDQGLPLWPFLIVDWVEWEGPIMEAGPTAAQRDYFPADAAPEKARELLARFATMAFRRPVREPELDRLAALVERERKSGEPFAAALNTAFLALLCSKDFFYIVEGAADRKDARITDWELASRLSYFL